MILELLERLENYFRPSLRQSIHISKDLQKKKKKKNAS